MKDLLILIDCQNDFITGALANPQAKAAIPAILNLVRNHVGDIIATHDTHFNAEQCSAAWPPISGAMPYESTLEGEKLPVPHCLKLSDGWEIEPSVLAALTAKNEKSYHFHSIDKYTFGYHDWQNYLSGFTFDHITLAGFCTDICVVSNALILRMLYPNLRISVKKSCCAGVTPELHDAALKVMASCQIDIED